MFARDPYLTINTSSVTHVLIYTAAMGGIALFWTEVTTKAWKIMNLLADKMFGEERVRKTD